jgi:quercetin dioxygenase-like cupin family protein
METAGRSQRRYRLSYWIARAFLTVSPDQKSVNRRGAEMQKVIVQKLVAPRCMRALAFALSFGAAMSTCAIVPAFAQQAAATKVTALLKQALTNFPGHEVMMITLDIPPGGGSPAHRHPGHHVFGYVLEGTYKIKLDDGPATILAKGQTFYEAPGQLHAISANASPTEPAKVLVFMVAESGKPTTVPEKP